MKIPKTWGEAYGKGKNAYIFLLENGSSLFKFEELGHLAAAELSLGLAITVFCSAFNSFPKNGTITPELFITILVGTLLVVLTLFLICYVLIGIETMQVRKKLYTYEEFFPGLIRTIEENIGNSRLPGDPRKEVRKVKKWKKKPEIVKKEEPAKVVEKIEALNDPESVDYETIDWDAVVAYCAQKNAEEAAKAAANS
ncbi:hypothetical protein IKW73_00905 [Candidatus Saccharibacteria bacterium]|nr:hypothetical protein [Candidatus Saccharibacteria bacterium]